MVQFLLSFINIMKCLLFFLIFKHIPFLLCSIFYSPVFFTHTWKCSFLVTGSQRPSPAVMCLLWLKLPRKNNQCHCGVPYHQYTNWTARTTTASPLLVAPFGLYRWGTLSKHFLHHKLNGNTHLNPSATSGFQEVRLPPKMTSLMAPKSLFHLTMDDEIL